MWVIDFWASPLFGGEPPLFGGEPNLLPMCPGRTERKW
jgi:hypothetical protein